MTFQFGSTVAPASPLTPSLSYVIGEPGSGKSTLVSQLIGVQPHREFTKPFAHRLYGSGVYELGKRRPDFPGTDALSMSAQPLVLKWLEAARPFLVIAEGDRLGTGSFLDSVAELGYAVRLYVLWGPEAAAFQRKLRGSQQDEKWIDGRRSKVRNLMDRPHTVLEAGAYLPTIVRQMWETGDPVVRTLRGRAP